MIKRRTQQLLPIFPKEMEFITPQLGVKEEEGTVWYLFSGAPIFSHEKDDLSSFRYIAANLIVMGWCKNQDIVKVFGVSSDSVRKWKKKFKEGGKKAFFQKDNRQGHSHKLTPDVLSRIQGKLNEGRSVNSIAKEEGISEGSIRYTLKQGYIKKK